MDGCKKRKEHRKSDACTVLGKGEEANRDEMGVSSNGWMKECCRKVNEHGKGRQRAEEGLTRLEVF